MTPTSRERYTVLVVDDDPSVLGCYRKLLERAGYRTLTEADPRRVLAHGATVDSIDLILLDYKMPGMDGLSLLGELRRKDCKARCILLSAFLNEGVRQQAEILGVDRVFEKPVQADLLRGALAELLPTTGASYVQWNG
jgi:two-component system response regulator YesN